MVRAGAVSRGATAPPFGGSYAQARAFFLEAAAGAPVQSWAEPHAGRDGEALFMDVARVGPDDAAAVVLVSSGCHGVEGYAGSGVQASLLDDDRLRRQAAAAGVALVFIHALNPWGFSHDRRVTAEGVDLNRNAVDFDRPLPANPGYDALAEFLLPPDWPPTAADEAALIGYAARHGMAALQRAVSGGQYRHPAGLFHGGTAPTWSLRTLQAVLETQAARCARLAWIDLHSGLGESGVGERIFAGRDTPAARARALAWWGPEVSFTEDGSSSSALLEGNIWQMAERACPQANFTGLTLEFGTQPIAEVIQALRLDHWVAAHAPLDERRRDEARAAMRRAFYTDTPAWKEAVTAQGRAVVMRAIEGVGA